MNNYWDTGYDPFQELELAKHNIQQLAIAAAHQSDILKDLANRYNHQQVIIEQLVQQNQRLNDLLRSNRHESARQAAELYSIKNNLK
jgi:cell shape-determining protein MreC